MSLVFCDGFDAYSASQIFAKWTSSVNGGPLTLPGPGRLGYGQYLQVAVSGVGNNLLKGIPTTSTVIVGFAFYYSSTSLNVGGIFEFCDASANALGFIAINTAGQIQYINGSGTTVVTSASATLNAQAWCYIEAQVTFSNATSGSVTLRFNGQTVATAASVNTSGTNGNQCSLIGPYLVSGMANCFYDDLYVLNTTAPNNTFLGDTKILPLYPTGNGRVSGFSRFGGTSSGNYTAVNEVPPDGDSSYVYTATPGVTDAYTITTLSNVTTVLAVQVSAYARKDDTPSRVLAVGVGNGTTENFNAGTSLNTSYTYILRQMDINPLTSAAWTPANFSTLQLAQQLIS